MNINRKYQKKDAVKGLMSLKTGSTVFKDMSHQLVRPFPELLYLAAQHPY